MVFRPDVLPPDVEIRRAVTALQTAETAETQRVAAEKLLALTPQLRTPCPGFSKEIFE